MNKMKCHVLMVDSRFPSHHLKAGKKTEFPELISMGIKIHTLRENYGLWEKRIDEVTRGEAYLSLRYWSGRPYHSKQHEWLVLTHIYGVGIQKLSFCVKNGYIIDDKIYDPSYSVLNKYHEKFESRLAENDGLEYDDFKDWFRSLAVPVGFREPLAIIHFTPFRYNSI